MNVTIVATGTANLASVVSAFERRSVPCTLTRSPRAVEEADRVVLPGVGSFAAAAERLEEDGLMSALRERIEANRPTLAICLGMQLFGAGSEESPGVPGLGVVAGTARRFPADERVPQLGWNQVTPVGSELLESGQAYFANTYRFLERPLGWACATTDYAGLFISAIERGPVLACQFHPELSGAWGDRLLARWLERSENA